MVKRQVVPKGGQKVVVAPGIYLKINGKYLAYFRDPGRKEHWKEFPTFGEAKRWRAKALVDPTSVLSGRRQLREAWEQLLSHQSGKLRPTTVANWKQEWRAYIEPALGGWPVGKITIVRVKDFLAELEARGVGAATRQKCRAILHRVLEEAVENGEIPTNPAAARGTRIKAPQPKKARILTPAEIVALIEGAAAVAGATDALAIETMFWLGLRIGEMAGLQARDLDQVNRELTVRRTVSDAGGHLIVQDATKSNKFRVLPIPDPLWPRLSAHIRDRGLIGQAPLFPTSGGRHIRPNNWRRRVWQAATTKAGILDPPTPHSARRTTASLLSAANVSPATIMAILGHATLQQTAGYISVPRSEIEAAMRKLGEVYGS